MTTSRTRLGAALFNGDHGRLAEEVARLVGAGLDFIHLDVFDGHFVPDLGFPPRTIAALRPLTKLPFEVHLGAHDPLRFVPHLVEAGADLILFHAESVSMLYEAIFTVRDQGVKVGVALGLGTPLTQLEPVIGLLDAVLLLARVTGEGAKGATFNPRVLPRLHAVDRLAKESNGRLGAPAESTGPNTLDLQVAGGIKREHVQALVAAGATALALGGGLYKAPDLAREVAEIRKLTEQGAIR